MAFQVIADADERDTEMGRVRIEFHVSRLVRDAAIQRFQTETGTMAVSTPETTAFDLVRFPASAGHWSNIATVLRELAGSLDPALLAAGSERVARSDFVEAPELANALADALEGKRLVPTPLSSTRDSTGAPLDPRWRVLVNDDVEPDL
jgi:hypothetical protein